MSEIGNMRESLRLMPDFHATVGNGIISFLLSYIHELILGRP
jgi:hypothetical protein